MRTKSEYGNELRRRIAARNMEGVELRYYAEAIMEEFIDLAAEALAEMRADLSKLVQPGQD